MASTLGDLKLKLNYSVGTSETNLFTTDKRENAINKALNAILEQYPVNQYIDTASVTFTNGTGTLPSTCLRPMKLYDSSNNEYTIINQLDFDQNIPYTATIKYDTATSSEKLYIYPVSTTSLSFKYIVQPTTLSDDSDSSRLPSRWDDGWIELAAYFLFVDVRNLTQAQAKQVTAKDLLGKTWQIESARFQSADSNGLQSVFYKYPLLGSRNYYTGSSLIQTMVTTEIVTTDTSMSVNFAFITNSGSRLNMALPSTASIGDTVEVIGQGTGGWKITQGAGQSIIVGASTSTTGLTGYVQSTAGTDYIKLVCISPNVLWKAESPNSSTITVA